MSKIGYKLLFILLLSVGGLLITVVTINYSIEGHFREYVYREKLEDIENLKNTLETIYLETGSWEINENLVNRHIQDKKILIYFEDIKGNLIYTNIDTRGHGRRQQNFNLEETNKYTLKNQKNQDIAYLYSEIPGHQQRGNPLQTSRFIEDVNKTLFSAAGFMIILSIIIGYFLSKYLTSPLLKMNKMTDIIAKGNYDHRVKIRGNDEISQLGNSLNQMADRLKYLEKIRKESTGDLVHELKTPIAIISNYLTAITDGIFTADKTVIKEIQDELIRLEKLTESLEKLADTEQKIINMQKEEIELEKIIKKVVKNFSEKARKKEINIDIISNDTNTIKADPDALKTIFNNLISNAIKYSHKNGEIKIILKKENNKPVVLIKDWGIGIPDKDIPFIFERFYRTDKSRSTKTGGTGLGLAITKELVNAHNGKISVKSNQKPTVFEIIFQT